MDEQSSKNPRSGLNTFGAHQGADSNASSFSFTGDGGAFVLSVGTKACAKCGLEKSSSEFSRASKSRDGLQCYCRPCMKSVGVAWRNENVERSREHQRSHYQRLVQRDPGYATRVSKAHRLRHPEHARARDGLNNAIKLGLAVRPDGCSRCGLACVPHGHHPDYTKPLEVLWLCVGCHHDEHRRPASVPSGHDGGALVSTA